MLDGVLHGGTEVNRRRPYEFLESVAMVIDRPHNAKIALDGSDAATAGGGIAPGGLPAAARLPAVEGSLPHGYDA